MRFRRIALLVVLYLALDFANPMMPGAVQLVEGCLEAVSGCQSRGAEVPAPALTMVPRDCWTVAARREPTLPAGRVIAAAPPAPLLIRASSEPRCTPASSPDDD
jgi:hypothetical protein